MANRPGWFPACGVAQARGWPVLPARKKQVGGAGRFAALVADGCLPGLRAGVAAIELNARQVQVRLVQVQKRYP